MGDALLAGGSAGTSVYTLTQTVTKEYNTADIAMYNTSNWTKVPSGAAGSTDSGLYSYSSLVLPFLFFPLSTIVSDLTSGALKKVNSVKLQCNLRKGYCYNYTSSPARVAYGDPWAVVQAYTSNKFDTAPDSITYADVLGRSGDNVDASEPDFLYSVKKKFVKATPDTEPMICQLTFSENVAQGIIDGTVKCIGLKGGYQASVQGTDNTPDADFFVADTKLIISYDEYATKQRIKRGQAVTIINTLT